MENITGSGRDEQLTTQVPFLCIWSWVLNARVKIAQIFLKQGLPLQRTEPCETSHDYRASQLWFAPSGRSGWKGLGTPSAFLLVLPEYFV